MKTCRKCSETKLPDDFYGNRNVCKECIKAKVRTWKANNPERRWETQKKWEAANPDRVLAYREKYAPRAAERHHEYYMANQERLQANARAWAKANPEKVRESINQRKHRKRGNFVERVRRDILAVRDNWMCGLCGEPVTRENWSLDHILPLSKGGEHSYGNTQIAHRLCNARKGAKVPAGMPSVERGTISKLLTLDQEAEIRERNAAGEPQHVLAQHFGVSQMTVSRIVRKAAR